MPHAPSSKPANLCVNDQLWIISDTHFGHKNIVKYQKRPETHETIMLSEWIRRVRDTDQILHMGDVFLGRRGDWAAIISRMPGEKFLIKGNHDKAARHLYDQAGFTIIAPFCCRRYAFTHRPISKQFPAPKEWVWHTNIHGHTHSGLHRVDEGTPLEGKTYINVSADVTDLAPLQLGSIW